ncbi:MAG: carboxypeptidase regulatory-like domain-containing protein, partial [Acidobacteriaceae bacterium]|nr:carboxypeptidase regulatory-like domain-containing protein [Acidobacteriaceae bacterium]
MIATRLCHCFQVMTLAVMFFALFPSAGAQETRATLNGRVQDSAKAAIPNAHVKVTNAATGIQTDATTDGEGNYTVPFLTPGMYSVSAEAPGFSTATQNNIELHVGDKLTVDLGLSVGTQSEVVTVTTEAPLLEEGTATRSGLIDNKRVTELPLNGRNPFQLANLVPGVTFQGNPSFTRPFDNGDNANFSINGGLRQTNSFLIDGAPDDAISDTAGDRSHANQNVAYIPTVDATQEFKIVNNFYDAQYGRTGGGIFNVSTKSGANVYHGSAYEFMRRYQFDANSISNKAAGAPRYAVDPATKANLGGHTLDQYGFAVTGPLSIPGLYDAKDRTFFLFGFENYKEASPTPTLTGTISTPERNGDFSGGGEPIIYDPYTTRLGPGGVCCIRDPFPGNRIPSSRLANSAGYKLAQAYPKPNYAASGSVDTNYTSANNYNTGTNLSQDNFRNWIGRIDQSFGQRERLYVRYAHGRRNQVDNGAFNFTGPLLDAQDPLARVNDNGVIDSITTLTPRIVMDLRASITRYNEMVDRSRVYGYDITSLGFSQSFANSRFVPVPPRLTLSGTGVGDAGTRNPRFGISNIIGFQPGLQMLYGKHSLHVGADLRDIRYNTGGGSFVYGGGQFTFNQNFTQSDPTASTSSSQGSAVASLLLGAPASGIIQYTPRLSYRWRYYAIYLQDDFKLSRRLTLNLGIRYDIEGSPTEGQNRQNRGFAYNTTSPLAAAAKSANPATCPACANLTGGLLFAGAAGQPREAFNTQYGHVQPRAGAVFRANNNLILRGGYGMFFLPEAAFGAAQGFAQDTAYIASNVAGGTTADQYRPAGNNPNAPPLNNPFPTVLQPSGSTLGLSTFQGQSIIFNNVDRKIPYVHQFSFGLQQQFPGNVVWDVSYVGSRTNNINTNDNQAGSARNLNVLSNAQIAQVRAAAAAAPGSPTPSAYLAQTVTNPFAGLIPGSSLNGATVSRQQLLLPYPQFQTVTYGQESVGKIWYDSLQMSLQKRFAQGLTLMGAYTWSKTQEAVSYLNSQDAAPFKNISASDRPQRLVISGVWELPFGRGHHFGGHVNRPMELLIGGWQLNYIETIQSGAPASINSGAALIADPNIGGQKSNSNYFNSCVRQVNGTSLAPNSAHNGFVSCSNPAWQITNTSNLELRAAPFQSKYIRNPNAPLADLSFSKRFNITERYNAQFRFETFNVTNTAVRSGPNMTPTSNQFGFVAVSQSNIPRQMQLGF